MSALPRGLYEEVISELRRAQLERARGGVLAERRELDPAESHAALADYLRSVIANAFDGLEGEERLARQVELCNRVVRLLQEADPESVEPGHSVAPPGELLLSISESGPVSGRGAASERPDTPLAFGCLLTGTRLDPSLVSQIKKEIRSADRIDILCSFIKWSGLRIIADDLRDFAAQPAVRLRVITTSYMGATDLKAIEHLAELPGCEVRVSYDTHRTRLHAKAYTFHRDTGFGSAYIGSANLSHAAMTDGLEWTVKISQFETPHLWQKVAATFETYWNDPEFVPYGQEDRSRLAAALQQEPVEHALLEVVQLVLRFVPNLKREVEQQLREVDLHVFVRRRYAARGDGAAVAARGAQSRVGPTVYQRRAGSHGKAAVVPVRRRRTLSV